MFLLSAFLMIANVKAIKESPQLSFLQGIRAEQIDQFGCDTSNLYSGDTAPVTLAEIPRIIQDLVVLDSRVCPVLEKANACISDRYTTSIIED